MFFLVGPTAVGKTDLAAEVAQRIGAEIISADAFQIYAGLEILTAKPDAETLANVPHHLIGEIPLTQSFDAAQFAALAKSRAEGITRRGRLVIVAGGTGLYVRALTHGLSELPSADETLRVELEATPLAELQRRYARLDPAGAGQIDLKNKRRLVRAIEVCLLTGKPFSAFRDLWGKKATVPSGVLLTRDRADFHTRIDARVAQMFERGLLEEIRQVPEIGRTASQVIGLRETRACLRKDISQAEAIAQIQLATRRYAKRQLTWFRSEPSFEPLNLTTFPPASAVDWIVRKALSSLPSPHV
ncbi:MAG: tRNA dimethylallyltransferase [Chthoniobacter sp.]|jgi:tRNA dimethylallyltransferase|nr:tRNA dimethylallyltransferase [Chthoniobacter sp.]